MKSYGAAFWMYCLFVLDGRECCRYLRISKKVVNVIFIAVPIRAAFAIAFLLFALAKNFSTRISQQNCVSFELFL